MIVMSVHVLLSLQSSPLSNQSLMFNYTYTPTSNDSSWIGLNKAASESGYIAVSY